MLAIAEEAVSIACKVLEQFDWTSVSKWSKSDNPRDLVSQADRAIEESVTEFLMKETPDISVIGEEFSPDTILNHDKAWILDPIDGTMNFLQGFDYFTISLGLLERGTPDLGVVCNPARKQIYRAQKNCGAFRDETRIESNQESRLQDSLVCLEWGRDSHSIDIGMGLMQLIVPKVRDYRYFGGAAQTICHIAEGKLDLYIDQGLKIWDYAAGWCIVTEAGGTLEVVSFKGTEIVVAGGNASLVKEVINLVRNEVID